MIGLATREASAANVVFGDDPNQFTIEFVEIGDPGNPADTTGVPNPTGAVAEPYIIAKTEISRDMINKANSAASLGIGLAVTTPPFDGADRPATGISWFEAVTFVNYLNTSTGNPVAYKFDNEGTFELWQPGDAGYDASNPYRNSQAAFFLPSTDEWYKAAYFDAATGAYFDYPTGSNIAPVGTVAGTDAGTAVYTDGIVAPSGPADIDQAGGLSPYGTIGQGGNVFEWEESADLSNDDASEIRGLRGGAATQPDTLLASSSRSILPPGIVNELIGFRVAGRIEGIPEPTTPALLAVTVLVLGSIRRRRRPS
jgi:sulfatase modifying factor 1